MQGLSVDGHTSQQIVQDIVLLEHVYSIIELL